MIMYSHVVLQRGQCNPHGPDGTRMDAYLFRERDGKHWHHLRYKMDDSAFKGRYPSGKGYTESLSTSKSHIVNLRNIGSLYFSLLCNSPPGRCCMKVFSGILPHESSRDEKVKVGFTFLCQDLKKVPECLAWNEVTMFSVLTNKCCGGATWLVWCWFWGMFCILLKADDAVSRCRLMRHFAFSI